MPEPNLDGIGVLVTRPQQQAGDLIAAIEDRGGTAIAFPVIDIQARDRALVEADAEALESPDISIFVSRNAVEHGLPYAAGQLAAIGPATAAAIRDAGKRVDICPASGFDSEHLLLEPGLGNIEGRTVRIIRGSPGRELLAKALRGRGATVDYLSTYDRKQPSYAATTLEALEKRWRKGEIRAVVVMSAQSFKNLAELLPDWCRRQMRFTPLVTPAIRVLKEAQSAHPACSVTLATGPEIDDIIDAIAVATQRSTAGKPVSG
jgi:uroporphyrinogen-III synthase